MQLTSEIVDKCISRILSGAVLKDELDRLEQAISCRRQKLVAQRIEEELEAKRFPRQFLKDAIIEEEF